MTSQPRVRDEEVVPDACQIIRETAGNTGEATDPPPDVATPPPQVRPGENPRSPQLPKLTAMCWPWFDQSVVIV
jgi:hypothetical protein